MSLRAKCWSKVLDEVLDNERRSKRSNRLKPAPSCQVNPEAGDLVERSRKLLERMHAEDREEAIDLHEKIGSRH